MGDLFGGQVGSLDVVQGATARVRDLSVGFGSLRTVRAETPVVVPKLHADLQLADSSATLPLRPANFVSGLESMPVTFTPTKPVG